MSITTNQKRFLIIWILFHSFALFVNLADIRFEVPPNNFLSTPTTNGFWPFCSFITNTVIFKSSSYLKVDNFNIYKNVVYKENDSTFNPDNYYHPVDSTSSKNNFSSGDTVYKNDETTSHFNGIFYSYGIAEYFFYIVLGFSIIYVPKLWKTS